MSLNEELKNILSDTERFLKQHRELYGDTIFVSRNEPPSAGSQKSPETANPATGVWRQIFSGISQNR